MKDDKNFYYAVDYDNAYEPRTEYYEVRPEYHVLFLLEYKDEDIEMVEKMDISKDAVFNVYEPKPVGGTYSEKHSDIVKALEKGYERYIFDWAASSQDPNNWGPSIGMQEPTDDEVNKIKKKYSLDKYIDKRINKFSSQRKSYNREIRKRRKIYKKLGLKKFITDKKPKIYG